MINKEKEFELQRVGTDKLVRDVAPVINANGDLTPLTGKDAIVNAIRTLLMTPRGLYPFDPEYGSKLHEKLFEMADEPTEREIYYEVKNVVERYVPEVKVSSVNMEWIPNEKMYRVDVYLTIQNEINKTRLSVDIMNAVNNSMFNSLDDVYADSNTVS